ncbi:hypothetical protein RyT2_29700 [Pseudolactococcus yaeyamensis]
MDDKGIVGVTLMVMVPIVIIVCALGFFATVAAVVFPELCAWPVIAYTALFDPKHTGLFNDTNSVFGGSFDWTIKNVPISNHVYHLTKLAEKWHSFFKIILMLVVPGSLILAARMVAIKNIRVLSSLLSVLPIWALYQFIQINDLKLDAIWFTVVMIIGSAIAIGIRTLVFGGFTKIQNSRKQF